MMTSRERVRAAINHKEPDKVPIDWGMLNIASIHADAYKKLIEYLGRDEEINIHDPIQVLAWPSDYILDMFEVDTRYVVPNNPSNWKLEYNENGDWVNEFGTLYKRVGDWCDFAEFPLADCETIEDLKRFKMPDPTDPARFEGLGEKTRDLYENTDFALCSYPVPTIWYVAWSLRGYENFLLDTAADPEFANYICDMIVDYHLAYMEEFFKATGQYFDIIWSGDDWGSQYGPLISPDYFRSDVKPRIKKLVEGIKKFCPDAKMGYHCCGSIHWCLGDLIDCGVDIIQPVQVNAADMDIRELKKEFGNDVVFHGATDNQGKFHTTPEIITDDVKEKMEVLKPGGGYIFSSCHNIQTNCPPENILALFEAAKKYRNYE